MDFIQTYDVIMLIVLVGAALFGAWKGMAWQLASLASMVVSMFAAIHFSAPIAPYFSAQDPWNRYLAMLVLFVMTSLGIWLLFRLVSGAIERVKLKEFDRQMGALFGLAKGMLYCIVITFFAVTLSETTRQPVLKSRSGDIIARVTRHANPILPSEIRDYVGKYIDELDQKLDPKTPPDAPTENVEQKVNQAVQQLEEIGRQKLDAMGNQAEQKINEAGQPNSPAGNNGAGQPSTPADNSRKSRGAP
jgi:membrane protein required for colicin V production